MNTSKVRITTSAVFGKICSIVGYTFVFPFFIVVGVGLADMGAKGALEATIFSLFCLAFCVLLIMQGIKIKRRNRRFRLYVGLISAERMTSLESMAARISKPLDFVRSDLQKMIDKRFFINAHINGESNQIIIYSPVVEEGNVAASAATVKANCKSCGAFYVRQERAVSHCEYCGSPLS